MLPRDPRQGSFFDFSGRTKLRLTGADRVRFINGQITNDVRKAAETSALAACVLNAKGKLNAHIFLSVESDSILVDADPALREPLAARLERYIIADDVQVEDITEKFAIFHVIGPDPNLSAPKRVSVNRFGLTGVDLWIEPEQADRVRAELATNVSFCDDNCAEQFRIEQGIPRWGKELTEDTNPVEANLEQSCIDYEKGCYLGQEVISRMKMSGQRNKGLYGLIGEENRSVTAGTKLWATHDQTKEVGWITSAIWSDRLGQQISLGYVKRPFNQIGAELRAAAEGGQTVPVRVFGLPFNFAGR